MENFHVLKNSNFKIDTNSVSFSVDQLECICEALYQEKNGERLVTLFKTDCIIMNYYPYSSSVQRAYLYALYHSQKFDQLFNAISHSKFEEKYFEELQDLWYKARYAENELRKQKELGPVEKYRLRKKHPPPRSIWDGQETIYSFKENSRKVLRQFYRKNKYPTTEEKKDISRITGLKLMQISNWFKNRRQRDKSTNDGSNGYDYTSMNGNMNSMDSMMMSHIGYENMVM
uniref:Homeobox domain-containing protein n=1 Tax=Parastrongyloides trichosuri TaxID=131310 RepID=A0A0N4ZA45_PARTI